MNAGSELVHLETRDGVATITLDSPHNRNALSRQLLTELAERLTMAEQDVDVRSILLRSADRTFCSGGDLSEMRGDDLRGTSERLTALLHQLATATKPVVIVLAGAVRAGGLGLVGAVDIVIAAESVTFALTEVRLAVSPAVISLTLLERMTSRAASDLFLTARTFDAHEAAAIGLVTRVVPDDELDVVTSRVLDDLGKGSPQGLRETKRLLNARLVDRIERDSAAMAELSASLFASDAAQEAMQSFLIRKK